MNKTVRILISITIIILGIVLFYVLNIKPNKKTKETNQVENAEKNKTAIIYFSATGNTKKIANYIKEETNGDLIEIEPKEKYTSEDLDYNDDCRANKEQNDDKARPEIANNIDVDKYDTIYLGYPIWWGDVPKIILTFLDNHNLDGKTIIPFCTSGGSDISKSEETLKNYKPNIKWESGQRFGESTTQEEIKNWIKNR